jgi:hypothetical protein
MAYSEVSSNKEESENFESEFTVQKPVELNLNPLQGYLMMPNILSPLKPDSEDDFILAIRHQTM